MQELDLVVFPRHVDGERYVGRMVEFLSETEYRDLDHDEGTGTFRKDGTTVYWNTVASRETDGSFRVGYDHPQLGDEECDLRFRVLHRIADRTDRPLQAVEDEFHRKHRYVQYLVREQVTDFTDLFEFLADLKTNEAATVERVSRQLADERTSERRTYSPDIDLTSEGAGERGDD